MRLSLGPNLFFWERQATLDFYEEMARQPLDIIYLGETVCSKRRALRTEDWIELARHLHRQGKEVVLSTLTLIEAESELATLKRLCENGEFLVEANDLAGVQLMAERNLPFVTGPAVNIYNHQTLNLLARKGLKRWVMPVELSRASLQALLSEVAVSGLRQQVESEVFSFGKLPLAYSARCFSARAHNLPKDNCQFVCQKYADGLPMNSQEGQSFLTINGIQTMSGETYNLLGELDDMKTMGVDIIRLSPQSTAMEDVIQAFHKGRNGEPGAAFRNDLMPGNPECNGYWHGLPGMDKQSLTAG